MINPMVNTINKILLTSGFTKKLLIIDDFFTSQKNFNIEQIKKKRGLSKKMKIKRIKAELTD